MASVYQNYLNQVEAAQKKQKDEDIAALQKTNQAQKDIIKQNYEQEITQVGENYDPLFRKNEVQKVLNERGLERRAAELGLTDSGFNRTQMTANQLSYANADANLTLQRQKEYDTLAAIMNSKLTEKDVELQSGIAGINSAYKQSAIEQATSLTNEYNKAQADIEKARIEGRNKGIDRDNDNRKEIYKNLSDFVSGGASSDVKMREIYNYAMTYLPSDLELAILLDKAGLTEEEFTIYDANFNKTKGSGSLAVSPQEYNKRYVAGDVGNVYVKEWNYKNDGTLRYNFVINKATPNGFGGVDHNDVVSIYYPDNTPVNDYQNVKIKDLPKSIQQDITDKTAGKKSGDKFYYSFNLGQ